MIVTRKHLPRRTFLKGMGAAIALPDARRDDARRFGASAAPRRGAVAAAAGVHLRAERHHDGRLDAEGRRRGVRAVARDEAARAVPQGHVRALRASRTRNGMALGDGPGDHARAAASYLTGVHPAQDRRRRHPERHLGRPDRGAAHRRRDPVRLARARVRRFADRRQLRFGLLLRLHQQPRVARTVDADAAGDQPAPRLRAPVRRHRHQPRRRRPARGACAIAAASSIWSASGRRSCRPTSGRPTGASSTNTCRRSARSSSASSAPRRT